MPNDNALDEFIATWANSAASERANYQLFLTGLCQLLELPAPQPATADPTQDTYSFEHPVTFHHADGTTSTGFIDLYRRGAFVLETKQGVTRSDAPAPLSEAAKQSQAKAKKGHGVRGTAAWDTALQKARTQAENYARALPAAEGRPPFVVVVDVGHCIELYAEFSRSGGAYVPFPDPRTHRILLKDLRDPEIRERLRKLWLDPLDLDPSRRAAKVTRQIADALAKLAKSLEASGHAPKAVAEFLMRCLFTMFAEDVKLLPHKAFQKLLEKVADAPEKFQPAVEDLWRIMNTGGFHSASMENILRFNGGLFATPSALPLNKDQLQFLAEAAEKDWRDVEPAIFGTLLERALDPHERHKLGAHYTPRAYVERLVLPTIIEPLREEWENVQAAAFTLAAAGKEKDAHKEIHAFHRRLCAIRVLDPACGSGNFLYVTLEHLKRLEGEIFNTLHDLGESQTLIEAEGLTVDPHQLLGIELNPRAAVIAELVLWIGYLQWHYRTHGDLTPPEPVIKNFRNIENRDAVLDYDKQEIVFDEKTLKPLTRWDGRTTKTHPVTGEQVPDDTARIPVYKYTNPRPAQWPDADYVVGNPPFIGTARMRDALGDGYTECIRATIKEVPESSDFVMYWWNHAAHLVRQGKLKRFGFITTNSIRQTFNRRILEHHMNADNPVSIVFAIPDHPWVDSSDGAAVRIAMTVVEELGESGDLLEVISETMSESDEVLVRFSHGIGSISAGLSVGAAVASTTPLQANGLISGRGVQLIGAGFIVTPEQARKLGRERNPQLQAIIRQYVNGRDLTQTSRDVLAIDLFGLTAQEVQNQYPEIYQWVHDRVKPERDHNSRATYKDNWWIFGEPRRAFRPALKNLSRYIATVETSKHRFFVFLDAAILPDNMLVNIALDDAYALGVLSSRPHVAWAFVQGGRLGVGNDLRYTKSRCFETFPFPDATEAKKARIRELGERLDAHRKSRQALHPALTMTGMYNVLEKLRAGEALTPKDREIHEQGLVSVLKEIHDALDAAVCDAYGWPHDLSDEQILERLVALNAERAAEEKRGIIRYLRPEFQDPKFAQQTEFASTPEDSDAPSAAAAAPKAKAKAKAPWPAALPDQINAVRAQLRQCPTPATAAELAKAFKAGKAPRIQEILQALVALGHATPTAPDHYRAT